MIPLDPMKQPSLAKLSWRIEARSVFVAPDKKSGGLCAVLSGVSRLVWSIWC